MEKMSLNLESFNTLEYRTIVQSLNLGDSEYDYMQDDADALFEFVKNPDRREDGMRYYTIKKTDAQGMIRLERTIDMLESVLVYDASIDARIEVVHRIARPRDASLRDKMAAGQSLTVSENEWRYNERDIVFEDVVIHTVDDRYLGFSPPLPVFTITQTTLFIRVVSKDARSVKDISVHFDCVVLGEARNNSIQNLFHF